MFDKMKQLMEMKKQADRIKKELDESQVESNDVRGIKIVMNGSQNMRTLEIEQELLRPENKTRLESDLVRSFNAAVKKSQNLAAQKMKDVLPGFSGM